MIKLFKFSAFTLAETLLTLVIIGVVAAMTIPALMHNADEQKFVAFTQKSFADVSDATTRLETKYGDLEFWDLSDINTIKNYYSSVIDIVPYASESWNGTSINGEDMGPITYDFQTNNGFTWSINKASYDSKEVIKVTVDVNGQNPPNVEGIDIHSFYLLNDKVQPVSDCTTYALKTNKMPWLKTSMDACPQS